MIGISVATIVAIAIAGTVHGIPLQKEVPGENCRRKIDSVLEARSECDYFAFLPLEVSYINWNELSYLGEISSTCCESVCSYCFRYLDGVVTPSDGFWESTYTSEGPVDSMESTFPPTEGWTSEDYHSNDYFLI
ncbi:uncharacterized protein LOC129747753 [Uranotaenia lowii]|uniref:uncharacterized protein LOC129747753 n=1 Tax=Uranotaenia lowii TaxID=190385 RepID=UPI00247A3D2D|nr:uncharacterized protein LOC129747753 [Uranotaenia lowii]